MQGQQNIKLQIVLRIFTAKLIASDSFTQCYCKRIIFKYRVDGVVDRHKVKTRQADQYFV